VSFPFAGLPIGALGAAVPDATASGTDAALVSRWRDAERRLYPLVLSAPELYERSLVLVRATADELRAIDDGTQLVARFAEGEQLVLQAAHVAGLPVAGVDVAAVAGAAFALRHGELEAAATRAAARDALAAEPPTPRKKILPPRRRVSASFSTVFSIALTSSLERICVASVM